MKVVIIEDDPEIVETVTLIFELRWPDSSVLSSGEGRRGIELVESATPDIVILDIGLPDISGFEVCRQIRGISDVPVIILTVRDQEVDVAKGLELGADDYVTKPFSHIELLARVQAVLRRSKVPAAKADEKPFASGELEINFMSREVQRRGDVIKLTPIEFSLLYHLAKDAGRTIPHHTLLEKVWGTEYTDAADYLKVYIQRLREKIEPDPRNPRYIISDRGSGYRLAKLE